MHTPGPWRVETVEDAEDLCVMAGERWICGEIDNDPDMAAIEFGFEHGMTGAERFDHMAINFANARLIAAAPDLYEALADAIFYLKSLGARLAALDLDNTETYGCLKTATMFASYLDAALAKASQQQGSTQDTKA